MHVPAVPPAVVGMQRAGVRHVGPVAGSHAAPSAAGATHVPIVEPVGNTHVAPAVHRVTTPATRPQLAPAAASGCATHTLVVPSQVSPASPLQSGPVLRFASHVAPAVATSAMQMPLTGGCAVVPTHAKPASHGRSRLHDPPLATGVWQVIVDATQTSV